MTELAAPFEIGFTAACRHIKVLGRAGLVVLARQSRSRLYRLKVSPLQRIAEWLRRYGLEARTRRAQRRSRISAQLSSR